jgi:hypothetical protein
VFLCGFMKFVLPRRFTKAYSKAHKGFSEQI